MAKVARSIEHLPSYYDMLKELAALNPDAAWWLEEAAKVGKIQRCGFLTYCFIFSRSPQGHDFWYGLCVQMRRGFDRMLDPQDWEYEDEEQLQNQF